MKQRVISGILIALITILCAYFGSYLLEAVLLFIAFYGCYEYIKISSKRFDILLYSVMLISVLLMRYLHQYSLQIILFEMLLLLAIGVFYEKENFEHIVTILLMSIIIGFGIYNISHLQIINKWLLGYIFIISYITDVFAFFVGLKFGKHKLNERISPKKTIEGSIGGWLFGFLISFLWAMYFNYFSLSKYLFIIASLFLPLVSQVGDLVFSMIKRYYGVKDFSNLIPGHGGILDRFDILLVVLPIVFCYLLIRF